MSNTMTLKDACRRYGMAYHRAWYLLARGRVTAQVIGRTWQLSEKQAEELKAMLAAKRSSACT
jgi:hypothetical protein